MANETTTEKLQVREIPLSIKVLLGPRLTTENPRRYWEMFEQFADAIAPRNMIEWLWLRDIVDFSWEIARLRRYRLRRDLILRELDFRRERIAPLLRAKSDELIDVTAETVPLAAD